MNRKHYHITLVIALVMALSVIPGAIFADSASAAETISSDLAAPKLINHAASASTIKNTWNTVKNAKGYEVFRSTKIDGTYKRVKTIKSPKTVSWTDKKLKESKFYFYKVRAYRYSGNRKVYGAYSAIQGAAPTEHPNWEYSISNKSEKTKKVSIKLTNKSRHSMVFLPEGLYVNNNTAFKKWKKLGNEEWKDMTDSQLKKLGLTLIKGKKVTVKPGKTAKLTYKSGTAVKYTKYGRIISEFRYNGGTYGVFHSYKYGTSIWAY